MKTCRGEKIMISIIVPALNEAEWIEGCMRSLQNQNYSGEYEIILLDNGSEDGTKEIAKKYCDKLIRVPDLEFLYQIRNKGIQEADGEIIAQIDADCLAPPNWLNEAKESLEDNILVSGPVFPLEDSEFLNWAHYIYNTFMRISINKLQYSTSVAGNSAFYKNKAKQIGGFKNKFPADGKFGMEMRDVGSISFNQDMIVRTSMRRYFESFGPTVLELIISQIKLRQGDGVPYEEADYFEDTEYREPS